MVPALAQDCRRILCFRTFDRTGGDRFRLGHHKSGWRAVVDQQATLKADHTLIANNRQFSMVA